MTNILLQFLTTPRADAKRFEMLTLLATILAWTDEERERAGLQRGTVEDAEPTRCELSLATGNAIRVRAADPS